MCAVFRITTLRLTTHNSPLRLSPLSFPSHRLTPATQASYCIVVWVFLVLRHLVIAPICNTTKLLTDCRLCSFSLFTRPSYGCARLIRRKLCRITRATVWPTQNKTFLQSTVKPALNFGNGQLTA